MFSRPKILFLVSLLFVALLNPKFNPYLLFKFLMSSDIVMTRLVVSEGIRVTQVVAGVGRLTVHMDLYGDVLSVWRTIYPILLVVHLSM